MRGVACNTGDYKKSNIHDLDGRRVEQVRSVSVLAMRGCQWMEAIARSMRYVDENVDARSNIIPLTSSICCVWPSNLHIVSDRHTRTMARHCLTCRHVSKTISYYLAPNDQRDLDTIGCEQLNRKGIKCSLVALDRCLKGRMHRIACYAFSLQPLVPLLVLLQLQ